MKKLLLAMLLIYTHNSNAGVFTYMAASSAESSAKRTEELVKNKNTPVTVTGSNSVSCEYKKGYCEVGSFDNIHAAARKYFPNICEGSCELTPAQYLIAYTGFKQVIKSITYTYISTSVAIIEY